MPIVGRFHIRALASIVKIAHRYDLVEVRVLLEFRDLLSTHGAALKVDTVADEGRGMAFGGSFPTIYDKNGTYLRFKLDMLGLYYSNNNAWYGRPDLMLNGIRWSMGSHRGQATMHGGRPTRITASRPSTIP